MKPVVIARYSIVMMALANAVVGAMLALLCHSFLPPEIFAALAVLLFAAGVYRRNAIWIEKDRLFYRASPLMLTCSMAIDDIADVALGEEDVWNSAFMWTRVIAIKLRGGGTHTVGQVPLMPSLQTVLARLRDALGLPKVAA